MLAKRTYKNQITIPKAVMEAFPGVEYFDVQKRNKEIVLRPVTIASKTDELERIRDKIAALGITEKEIEAAVRWGRSRRL